MKIFTFHDMLMCEFIQGGHPHWYHDILGYQPCYQSI